MIHSEQRWPPMPLRSPSTQNALLPRDRRHTQIPRKYTPTHKSTNTHQVSAVSWRKTFNDACLAGNRYSELSMFMRPTRHAITDIVRARVSNLKQRKRAKCHCSVAFLRVDYMKNNNKLKKMLRTLRRSIRTHAHTHTQASETEDGESIYEKMRIRAEKGVFSACLLWLVAAPHVLNVERLTFETSNTTGICCIYICASVLQKITAGSQRTYKKKREMFMRMSRLLAVGKCVLVFVRVWHLKPFWGFIYVCVCVCACELVSMGEQAGRRLRPGRVRLWGVSLMHLPSCVFGAERSGLINFELDRSKAGRSWKPLRSFWFCSSISLNQLSK